MLFFIISPFHPAGAPISPRRLHKGRIGVPFSTPPRPLLAATAILTRKHINLSYREGCIVLFFISL